MNTRFMASTVAATVSMRCKGCEGEAIPEMMLLAISSPSVYRLPTIGRACHARPIVGSRYTLGEEIANSIISGIASPSHPLHLIDTVAATVDAMKRVFIADLAGLPQQRVLLQGWVHR